MLDPVHSPPHPLLRAPGDVNEHLVPRRSATPRDEDLSAFLPPDPLSHFPPFAVLFPKSRRLPSTGLFLPVPLRQTSGVLSLEVPNLHLQRLGLQRDQGEVVLILS